MNLGACYYPEHWPSDRWKTDARLMRKLGLTYVRLGEFSWSRIEPSANRFEWQWLDDAIGVLHSEGLKIIMGTPTATPPKWLVDQMPDMLAIDHYGRERRFGSRRHYCFSHEGYRREASRITRELAIRYGRHPALACWQTDNEYGCHDTTQSFSLSALRAFRDWLAKRYGHIKALNESWGNVFWSMEYLSFDEVDLPNLTVTEANPAHWLAFRRFSSDQVISFNRLQVEILKEYSPNRDITHNAMGFYTGYDHHDLGKDLDVLGWDSYPLGFLETFNFSNEDKIAFSHQGHPDIAAFHHDLYRGCANDGRWTVLEQQPGPVNWAKNNPAPMPGMVKLWAIEAMAHGAELVNYFRWRQLPFGQEQMHAGLLRPDGKPSKVVEEVKETVNIIKAIEKVGRPICEAAVIFSYDAEWVTQIQPHGEGLSALWAAFNSYKSLRKQGLNVDIIPQTADISQYSLILVPCLPILKKEFVDQLSIFKGSVIIGPRTGSRDHDFRTPETLAPGLLQTILPLKVVTSETLADSTLYPGDDWTASRWLDQVETNLDPELVTKSGEGVCWRHGQYRYLAAWPEGKILDEVVRRAVNESHLVAVDLAPGLRIRRTENYTFVFNYSKTKTIVPSALGASLVYGSLELGPAELAILSTK